MDAVAVAALVLLGGMLLVSLANAVLAPRLSRVGLPRSRPFVSVLVPARDEAHNLRETIPALLRQRYSELEIVVLDDGSTDATAALIARYARAHPDRLRALHGRPLPQGWLGKNWACHQLAQAARGSVLVFCDADVRSEPDAIERTVAALENRRAGAVTALPRQELSGTLQRAVVPLITQLPVAATLPLALVALVRAPIVSMANGQWLAFDRSAYDACGGHSAVRAEVVEDLALGRLVKASGLRLLPLLARDLLTVRMYRNAVELRRGFVKNLYALAGGHPASFGLAMAAFLLTAVYPWAGALVGLPGAKAALTLLLAIRIVSARPFGHGAASVLLHPLGSLAVAALAIESFAGSARGTLQWKGRRLTRSRESVELLTIAASTRPSTPSTRSTSTTTNR